MWTWLANLRAERRQHKERAYWALREAEAMRMQHGAAAEQVVDRILCRTDIPHRRRRFMTLVRRQLLQV
jgi:hypothetical protein